MDKTKKIVLASSIFITILGLIAGFEYGTIQDLKKTNKEQLEKIDKLEKNQKPIEEMGKCAGC